MPLESELGFWQREDMGAAELKTIREKVVKHELQWNEDGVPLDLATYPYRRVTDGRIVSL